MFINYLMVFLINNFYQNLLKKYVIKNIFNFHILYKIIDMFKRKNYLN